MRTVSDFWKHEFAEREKPAIVTIEGLDFHVYSTFYQENILYLEVDYHFRNGQIQDGPFNGYSWKEIVDTMGLSASGSDFIRVWSDTHKKSFRVKATAEKLTCY